MLFLQKTALDSIAIWTPISDVFIKPIILSTGNGVDSFWNIDQPPQNVIMRQTLNRNIVTSVRPVLVSGSATFHPESDALVALREILQFQDGAGVKVPGIVVIINAGAILMDKYSGCVWTNPYSGPNRNKVLGDVTLTWTSKPATAVSLGSIASIYNTLSGVGII